MVNSSNTADLASVFFLSIFLSGFFPSHLHAQQDSSHASIGATLSSDGKTILSDAGAIIVSPLHFSGKEWLTTGAVIGGTILLIQTDQHAREIAQRNQSQFGDDVFGTGKEYGVATYGVAFSVALYAGGLAFKNDDVRETGLEIIEALGFAGAATDLSKIVFGRSRPYTEDGPQKFQPFTVANDFVSLPSGHSTVAFAISSVLSERFKNTFASVGLYSLASLTAFSRVYDDQHWLSDTFLGAAIGTFMGVTVSHLHQNPHGKSISLYPLPNGLGASFNF